tara:strand:+ start:398 stop:628 length:231 start_codon:yes stop_codon:yes gene_type:complete
VPWSRHTPGTDPQEQSWLDTLYNACAAGHASGVRLLEEERVKPEPRRKMSEMAEDKRQQRGIIDHERWEEIRRRWG